MTLSQLTNRLQDLCHNGHSLKEVELGFAKDGETFFYDVDRVTVGVTDRIIISGKSEEEAEKSRRMENMIAKVMNAIPKVKPGETKFIECPLCGEKHNHEKHMSASSAELNGHLWIKCADCGFLMGA